MKLEDILKAQGIEEDQINKIVNSMKENKIYTTSLENADDRYTKLKNKNTEIQKSLDTANTTIDDLKKNTGTIEELQSKVEQYEKDKAQASLNGALEVVLKDHKVKNLEVFKKALDMNSIKLEDGKIVGAVEQIENYKKSDPYLFESIGGTGAIDGDAGNDDNSTGVGEALAKQQSSQVDASKAIESFFN
ncbi:MAG: phage scaffolding protein [Paraclostridium sp.]